MISKSFVLVTESARLGFSAIPAFNSKELQEREDELLGKGAFGAVRSIKGCPRLAMKEIYLSGQPDRLKEITKFELEALSRFSHPGVLKYHQVLSNDDFFYVVMDRYHGDLQQFITDHKNTQKPIPKELLLSIVRQLADALAYVHAPYKVSEKGDVLPGIVHRDLKPANVLMSRDGDRVVIADFGLCKDVAHSSRTFLGTPAYMAPETLLDSKTSRASDIWALGVIIYELATLERPSFSHRWKPEDAKEFFVDGWKPDLSAIEDSFVKMVLEKIFVLDPEERLTARKLRDLLWDLDASASEAKPRISALEAALKDARTKHVSFEEGLQIQSKEVTSLRDTVATQAAELNFLRESLKKLAAHDPSWTPLMRAAAAGDIKAVKKHLSKKGKKNSKADMALMLAANVGHKDIVELLDPTDKDGVTALMRAAERDNVVVARALMTKQKKLRDSDGRTALIHAAMDGHKGVVEILLKHEKGMRDKQGHNALYYALRNRHTATAKIVLPHENPTDENGVTALMRAAARGDAEMVELLIPLQKGTKDKDGNTAFVHALKNKHEGIATVLRKHEAPSWTLLMSAAVAGDVETARRHLSGKDMKNSDGETALMLAAKVGNEDIVKLLDSTNSPTDSPADSREQASFSWFADRYYMDTLMTIYPFERNGLQSLFKVEK
ncbi:Atp-dependent protease subunit [Giardia duodenalis]|uniref:Atp-dependent protease subunit n=1 Tax=Giardia intestinalis TaxID=5741 RepID=V6TMY8_GIAIN|nr:Atp-dependent protease subunit [Giardia intestinalis]